MITGGTPILGNPHLRMFIPNSKYDNYDMDPLKIYPHTKMDCGSEFGGFGWISLEHMLCFC